MDSATDAVTIPEHGVAHGVIHPDTARRTRRQRRPSGHAPPLPRKIGISGKLWLGLITWVAIVTVFLLKSSPWLRITDHIDTWWLRLLVPIRTPWLTHLMNGIKTAGSGWSDTILGLGTVGA